MPVNLKDLSAHLGLSPTTVSRALSGYSDVSPATRERVRQAAQELGYQPNRAARQVALGRADAVGIVYSPATEFLGNPSFLQMLEGLARTLDEAGCDLLLAAAPTEDELPIYDRMVRGRRVDALVVAHTLREDPRIRYLQDSGFPFVAYGRTARADGFPWFDFDNEACSRLAVQALVAAGHRMIAYVHAPLHYNFAFQRHAGFLAAMRKARLPVDPACVLAGSLERRAGYAAARQLLARRQRGYPGGHAVRRHRGRRGHAADGLRVRAQHRPHGAGAGRAAAARRAAPVAPAGLRAGQFGRAAGTALSAGPRSAAPQGKSQCASKSLWIIIQTALSAMPSHSFTGDTP
ncbi:LacI family DNA-binding transcriptional regulator [Piscinibacter sakaiensis]|uniref:LacI family DNA-binding transcriptional regulator n=1 Tax=Piscinibacter sakaiensis TaxID=1547922 RepID=UPI00372CCE54